MGSWRRAGNPAAAAEILEFIAESNTVSAGQSTAASSCGTGSGILRCFPSAAASGDEMTLNVVLETSVPGLSVRRGKVRDVYDLGNELLLVSTDRISAFDWILPTGIPDKGRVLTQMSAFWFGFLGEPNHVVSTDLSDLAILDDAARRQLSGRSMIVRKSSVLPIECVVRGYLSGSGWRDYLSTGSVCGHGTVRRRQA